MNCFDAGRTAAAVFVAAACLGCSGDPTRSAKDGVIGSRHARIELPARARGTVGIEDLRSGMAVRFALLAASDAPLEMRGGVAHYRHALPGSDLVLRPTEDGVEDLVLLREPPAESRISYSLRLENVAGLRLVSRSLEFLDSGGIPRLRVAPPIIIDAHGAAIEAMLALSGCAHDTSPVPPWGRLPLAPGATKCVLAVTWDDSPAITYPAVLDPAWTLTSNSMAVGRKWFQAVRLTDGRVLVAGGTTPTGTTLLSELFDPTSGTWSMTAPMNVRRTFFAAAPLAGARALATGGASTSGTVSSAEIFDNGSWTNLDNMSVPRQLHSAVTLGDGRVLVAGGRNGSTDSATAEVFNPADRHWAPARAMLEPRSQYPLTLLASGQALAVSGSSGSTYAGSEVYDVATDTWTATAPMASRRNLHTATLLHDGRVLVAGGYNGTLLRNVELFEPGAAWTLVTPGLADTRAAHAAALLDNGAVLIAGGCVTGACISALASTELYDPVANRLTKTTDMTTPRVAFAAVPLPDGSVLAAAGESTSGTLLASSERFTLTPVGQNCTLAAECVTTVCTAGMCAPPTIAPPDAATPPLPDAMFEPAASPDGTLPGEDDAAPQLLRSTSFYGCALGQPSHPPLGAILLVLALLLLVRIRQRTACDQPRQPPVL